MRTIAYEFTDGALNTYHGTVKVAPFAVSDEIHAAIYRDLEHILDITWCELPEEE